MKWLLSMFVSLIATPYIQVITYLVVKLSYLNYYKAYTVTITEDGFWGNIRIN